MKTLSQTTHRGMRLTIALTAIWAAGCAAPGMKPTTASGEGSLDECIAMYTAGGAVVGGLVGNFIKSKTSHTAAGALVGGLGGYLLGWQQCTAKYAKSESKQEKNYEQAANELSYTSNQGSILRISEFYLDPSAVAHGGKIRAVARYYVMAQARKDIPVVESRSVKMLDPATGRYHEIALPEDKLVAAPGLRNSSGEFPIPRDFPNPEADFVYVFKVNAEGLSETKEVAFKITRDAKLLALAAEESRRRAQTPKVTPPVQLALNGAKGAKSLTLAASVVVVANSANLRAEPNLNAKLIGSAKKNARYPLVQTMQAGGQKWIELQLDDGNTAWVIASAVKTTE